jgi:Fur family transcriptional regulator, ferric uptake regulator
MENKQTILTGLHRELQEQGYRLTHAREIILQALVASGGHVTADGLVERIRHDSPRIGRMTVYRTLELLCDLGLLRPVYQGTGAAHFVLMDQGHHHHLVCSRCERIVEFDECVVDNLTETIGARFGFELQGHLLEFFGICPDCQVVPPQLER